MLYLLFFCVFMYDPLFAMVLLAFYWNWIAGLIGLVLVVFILCYPERKGGPK